MLTLKMGNNSLNEKNTSSGEGEFEFSLAGNNNKHVEFNSPKSLKSRQFKRSFHTSLSFRSNLDISNVHDEYVKGKKNGFNYIFC